MRELAKSGLEGYIELIGAGDFFTPELIAGARLLEYGPGECIMAAGGEVRSLMVLVSGAARICSLSPEGRLAVIAEAQPPHLLGDIEYLQNRPVLHDVRAKGTAVLISVPACALSGDMESLNFYRLVCRNLMRRLYNTSSAYSRALLYPARKRLAAYLLENAVEGRVYMKGRAAAGSLGITPRHLSRLLGDFRCAGILRPEGPKAYRLCDTDRLKKLAGEMA